MRDSETILRLDHRRGYRRFRCSFICLDDPMIRKKSKAETGTLLDTSEPIISAFSSRHLIYESFRYLKRINHMDRPSCQRAFRPANSRNQISCESARTGSAAANGTAL